MDDITFGQLLHMARLQSGLTARELGELCGFDSHTGRITINYWEADKREPSIRQLRLLAKALNVTIDSLIPE